MATSSHYASLIHQSLEQAADRLDDLTPYVYARYFAVHPQARALFGSDDDDSLKGEMLSKLVTQIMDFAEGRSDPDIIVSWASDHIGYGVDLAMFPTMFNSVKESLHELIGAAWSKEMDLAWDHQFAALLTLIEAAYRRFAPEAGIAPAQSH